MNLKQILKTLYEQKILTLRFKTSEERENFRVRLYNSKAREDKILEDILDEEKTKLRFEQTNLHTLFFAKIWLESRVQTEFEVIDIDDAPKEKELPGGSEIPDNME